ncbi:MAG: hypothetical protein ACTHL8_27160 [Burkholderiaceae bacterium]
MNATHDDDAFDASHPLPSGGLTDSIGATPTASASSAQASDALHSNDPASRDREPGGPGAAASQPPEPEASWHARLQASAAAPGGQSPPPTALASALMAALSGTPGARVPTSPTSPVQESPGSETLARAAAAADIVMRRAGAPTAGDASAAGASAVRPTRRPMLRASASSLRAHAGRAPSFEPRDHADAGAPGSAASDVGTGVAPAPEQHPAVDRDDRGLRAAPGDQVAAERMHGDEERDDGEDRTGTGARAGGVSDDHGGRSPDDEHHGRAMPSRAEGGDALLAGLGRRFRGATIQIEFELRTTAVRQVFRRDFVYVSQQAHALESSRRVQGIDRQRLTGALRLVERQGESIRATLEDAIVQARELVRRAGELPQDIRFTRAAGLQATIVSPYARLFVELMRLADEAISLLEGAWLMGALDSAERAELINECRRVLVSYKDVVRDQRHAIGEHVRAVNEERRRARGHDGLRRHDPASPGHAAMSRRHGPRPVTESGRMPGSEPGSGIGAAGHRADDEGFVDAP